GTRLAVHQTHCRPPSSTGGCVRPNGADRRGSFRSGSIGFELLGQLAAQKLVDPTLSITGYTPCSGMILAMALSRPGQAVLGYTSALLLGGILGLAFWSWLRRSGRDRAAPPARVGVG